MTRSFRRRPSMLSIPDKFKQSDFDWCTGDLNPRIRQQSNHTFSSRTTSSRASISSLHSSSSSSSAATSSSSSTKRPESVSLERLSEKQEKLYRELRAFYSDTHHVSNTIRPLADERHPTLSLRLINCLTTQFAESKKTKYVLTAGGDVIDYWPNKHLEKGDSIVCVYSSYQLQLRKFGKRMFDPFRRRFRVPWELVDSSVFMTTIGQMNFFSWAIRMGVIKWCEMHKDEIETFIRENKSIKNAAGNGGGVAAKKGGSKTKTKAKKRKRKKQQSSAVIKPRPSKRQRNKASAQSKSSTVTTTVVGVQPSTVIATITTTTTSRKRRSKRQAHAAEKVSK